jgi:hypothetical protein
LYLQKKIRAICFQNWIVQKSSILETTDLIKGIIDNLFARKAFIYYNLLVGEDHVTLSFAKDRNFPITLKFGLNYEERKNEYHITKNEKL